MNRDVITAEFSACRGPCNGGTRLCPCPEACHVPRFERMGAVRPLKRVLLNLHTRRAIALGALSMLLLASALAYGHWRA